MSAERHAVSTIKRHPLDVRIAHWVAAVSFILLGLSGFALFFPGFFFMTAPFGGGETARFLHPWIGLVLVLSYFVLFVRFFSACLWKKEDTTWVLRAPDVFAGREENLPEFGKFIAGQKMYFWGMARSFRRAACERRDHLASLFWQPDADRCAAARRSHALDLRGVGNPRIHLPRPHGDVGAGNAARDDQRHGDGRLGLETSPQVAARSGRR